MFDFWVGTWRGTWTDAAGKALTARITVVRSHDGCVIQESFKQDGERSLVGSSLSVFDARTSQWRQTWVDNSGAYLDFIGQSVNGEPGFARQFAAKDGRRISQRMRFTNIAKSRFDWVWERSLDDEKNWQLMWTIRYERDKP